MKSEEIDAIGAALGRAVVRTRTLAGGFSHETCLLELDDGLAVARMGGAADPAIEAAGMALARRARVPVPEVHAVCSVPAEEGARPFMVLDYMTGSPLSEVLVAGRLSEPGARALGSEVGRVAALIGEATFKSPGFFDDDTLTVRAERPWSQQLPEIADECMRLTPNARLTPNVRRAWMALCVTHAKSLVEVDTQARLVHSDFNPKNILVSPTRAGWRVDAVLDWEFTYSGCPYADAANMARFGCDYPAGFLAGFRDGFAEQHTPGRPLLDRWIYLGHVLDMFALSLLVTHPLGHPVADQAAVQIRTWVAHGVPGAAA